MSYELRALHDIARWERGAYTSGSGWITANVEPAEDSGAATLPGGSISVETGDLNIPEGAVLSVIKSGNWFRIDGSAETNSGKYVWYEPVDEDRRNLEPEDVYTPFAGGGKLLFVPKPSEQGIAQFHAPVLLLDEWVSAVSSAVSLELPSETEMATPSQQILDQLPGARNSSNPFVSAWAWRHTFSIGQELPPLNLDKASGWSLALRTRMALDVGGERAETEVVNAVQGASDVVRLEAMAMGAFSALELPTGGNLSSVRATLSAVAQRATAFAPYETAAPKLHAILSVTASQ